MAKKTATSEGPLIIRVHTDMDLNLKKMEKTIRRMSYPPIQKDRTIEFIVVSTKDENTKEITKSTRGGVEGDLTPSPEEAD